MNVERSRFWIIYIICLGIGTGCTRGDGSAGEQASAGLRGEHVAVASVVSALDGTCPSDCLGGSCVNGRCQPIQIAGGQSRPWFLAVDGIDVFFTAATSWSANRTSLLGGPITRIATGTTGVAVAGGWLLAAAEGSGEIRRSAPGSSQANDVVIASRQSRPVGIATDGQFAYWTNYGDGTVARIHVRAADDELPVVLASGLNHPEPIVLRGGFAYVGDADGVHRIDITSRAMMPLALGATVYGLAVDHSFVYWADYGAGTVMKTPLGGGELIQLAANQSGPLGVTVDAEHVFWTTYFGGTVMRSDLDGGNLTTMADGQIRPYSIVDDATALYWVIDRWDSDCAAPPCGGVMKVAK